MKNKHHPKRHGVTLILAIVIFISIFLSSILTATIGYYLVESGALVGRIDNNHYAAIAFLRVVLMCLIAGMLIAGIIGKLTSIPIRKILSSVRRLASGDYTTRITLNKYTRKFSDFSMLADEFNILAEELENTEMLRSDFINNFSHEFKTPIVSIAGLAKLVNTSEISDEQKKEYLSAIEEESMRLSYMATNVLNLTKIENQSILGDVKEFNLSEQLRNCFLLFEPQWTEKNLEFDIDFNEYIVKGNEGLLKEVWINLISNAIKFTPDNGMIKIKINENANDLLVSITNTGSEIAPENQKKIFNKFYQEDESHATKGNGIGLAIVKKVVDLHKGSVVVSSQNNITTFTVRLPK